MSRRGLNRSLRGVGYLAMGNRADLLLRRSCIGRIVSALTGVFIVACLVLWVALYVLMGRTGVLGRFSNVAGTVLVVVFIVGLIGSVIVAGLIGNVLRRQIWRRLLSRRNRFP